MPEQGPGHHHTIARKKWSKEVNIVAIECYHRLNTIDENVFPLKGIDKKCTGNY